MVTSILTIVYLGSDLLCAVRNRGMACTMKDVILQCRLIKTKKRLTFDIIKQADRVTFKGEDDGPYFKFTASNGYEVISRSRMDIQSERIWLLGGTNDDIAYRSGTMVFPSDEKRDHCYDEFVKAIHEWSEYHNGLAYIY